MTEEEWEEYIRKLSFQVALEKTIENKPDVLQIPAMQDLRYIMNDFDKTKYPEFRKQNPSASNTIESYFSMPKKQNDFTKPIQNLSNNIMQTMNKPLSNLNMPSFNKNKNNMLGNVMQNNQQTNLLNQTKQSLVKPQTSL